MKRQMINPGNTQELYERLHFSSVTRVGDMIWVAGQVGVNRDTEAVGRDMEEQARLAFGNLKTLLEAAGASMADVVEIMTFHTDLQGEETQSFAKVKDEFLPNNYPSWSGVGVSQLARPEFKIEIRAVAVVGCGED